MRAPPSLPPGLEIRGIGFVNPPICKKAALQFVVDLSEIENDRLPNSVERNINILGYSFPFYLFQGINNRGNSIYALLKFGIMKF